MKSIKKLCIIVISAFMLSGMNFGVRAGGDDCMSMDICPVEYYPYLATDLLGNVIMSNVPSDLKHEIKDWMETKWGEMTFKRACGRNNSNSLLYSLSNQIYNELAKKYGIPTGARNSFIISKNSGAFKCRFDSFGASITVPSPAISKINANAKNIVRWMLSCKKSKKLLPLEDYIK